MRQQDDGRFSYYLIFYLAGRLIIEGENAYLRTKTCKYRMKTTDGVIL